MINFLINFFKFIKYFSLFSFSHYIIHFIISIYISLLHIIWSWFLCFIKSLFKWTNNLLIIIRKVHLFLLCLWIIFIIINFLSAHYWWRWILLIIWEVVILWIISIFLILVTVYFIIKFHLMLLIIWSVWFLSRKIL
jgi:hypothetical protein